MKQYKVIALSVGGNNNKIYHSGEIVPQNAWLEGRAEELVAQGFLKPISDSKSEEKAIEENTEVIEPKEEKSIVSAAKKANKK